MSFFSVPELEVVSNQSFSLSAPYSPRLAEAPQSARCIKEKEERSQQPSSDGWIKKHEVSTYDEMHRKGLPCVLLASEGSVCDCTCLCRLELGQKCDAAVVMNPPHLVDLAAGWTVVYSVNVPTPVMVLAVGWMVVLQCQYTCSSHAIYCRFIRRRYICRCWSN